MKEFYRIPGIIGFMGNYGKRDSDLVSRYNELFFPGTNSAPGESSIRIVTSFGVAGILGRGLENVSNQGSTASNKHYSILTEGEYFSDNGSRQDSHWLLDQISTNGVSALDSLNGTYSLVVHDKLENLVLLGSDRYATRPFYYAVVEGMLLFSSDFRMLLKQMPSSDSVNYDAILDFISFGFVLKNDTLHQSIRVLGHGERLEWDGNKLTSQRYWDYPVSLPSSPGAKISDYLDGTFHAMRNAVKRRIEGKCSVGVTLSSGLDSRAIAACVADLRNEPVHCYHLGKKRHKNSLWATEICRRLNGVFSSVAYKDLDFEKLLGLTYVLLAGQFSLNQAHVLWLLSSLNIDDTYILDGQVQDTLLGPLYIAKGADSLAQPVNYPEEALKLHDFTPDDLLRIVLKDEWAERAISTRSRRIEDHFQGRVFEDKSALTQHFYYTTRGQRYVWGAPVLEYSLVDVGYPGMDYDFFDWAMHLPIELREPEARLYRKLLCSFYPDVAAVPWDATGTPLNIFKGRIKADYSLTGKDLWIHVIRRATSGRIDLSNFFIDDDMLFRKNRKFRQAMLALVAALGNYPANPISKTGIEKLVRMIMSGRNYFNLLQRILTILNFFEHYYEKPRAK
jgi:asparagine synthetase B (glutamine-hydrolysing)